MKDYLNPHWQALLARHGLTSFEALWQLDAPWFEEPNQRRGGWSGVSRFELALPEGGKQAFFLKRQENHGTFSWRHPIRGIPTFLREFRKIMLYRSKGIPSLTPVYFAMRDEGSQRAILVTEALTGFTSMEETVDRWLDLGAPTRKERHQYLQAVARLLGGMHGHGIQHNCFYPKHVFARPEPDGAISIRVIDLEKSRWRPARTLAARRDLYALLRQSQCWSNSDRMYFFRQYLGIDRLTPYAKWLWRDIEKRSVKKNRLGKPLRHLAVKSP